MPVRAFNDDTLCYTYLVFYFYSYFYFFRTQKLVWHGSDKHGVRDLESYCDAWHSSVLGKVGMASSLLRGRLLDQERYSCNNAFIVLCVEATSQEDYRKRRKRDLLEDDDRELTWEEFVQSLEEEEERERQQQNAVV